MGNSKYLDSLSPEEYSNLTKKLWTIQSHKCFICGGDIDLDLNPTNIDHIKPLVNGGKDDETNFALAHENCNKSKQDADLEVARAMARLSKIIKDAEEKHETPSLKHVLAANGGSLYDFTYKIENGKLLYAFSKTGDDAVRIRSKNPPSAVRQRAGAFCVWTYGFSVQRATRFSTVEVARHSTVSDAP